MLEELRALGSVNDAIADAYHGVMPANFSTVPAKPTKHFKKMHGPWSDGGSYAIYGCGNCPDEFAGGEGVRQLPNGDRVVQCPRCGCVDPSYWKDFEKFGLVE